MKIKRVSRRNTAFRPGDGVKVHPTQQAMSRGQWTITHYGWFIEETPDGSRLLMRGSSPEKNWPATFKHGDGTLEPADVGPVPESLGGDPVRWVLTTGPGYDRRYLRELDLNARYGWYDWVRDPREATHYKYLDGGAYVTARRLTSTGASMPGTERYTIPLVDAEVRALAEKYAKLHRIVNAKPKPPKAKRDKLAAEIVATFTLMTDLVTKAEVENAVMHAGAMPNRSRR